MHLNGNPIQATLTPTFAALLWFFASFVGLLLGAVLGESSFPEVVRSGTGLYGFLALLGIPFAAFQCILLFYFFRGSVKHRWRILLWFPITILCIAVMALSFWLPIENSNWVSWIVRMSILFLTASVAMGAAQWFFVIRAFGFRSGWIGFTFFGALINPFTVIIMSFLPYDRAFFYSLYELARSIHLPPDLTFINPHEYELYVRFGIIGLGIGVMQALYLALSLRRLRK